MLNIHVHLAGVSGPNLFLTLVNSLLRDPRRSVVNSYLWTDFLIRANVNKAAPFKGCPPPAACLMDTPERPADKTQATYATQHSRINICLEITEGLKHLVGPLLLLHESADPASRAGCEENLYSGCRAASAWFRFFSFLFHLISLLSSLLPAAPVISSNPLFSYDRTNASAVSLSADAAINSFLVHLLASRCFVLPN